jgi:hypothetical protein
MFRSSAAHEYLAQGTKRCLRDFYERGVHTNNEEVFAGRAECRSPVGTSARAIGGGVSGPEPGSGDFVHAERSGADCVLEKVGRAQIEQSWRRLGRNLKRKPQDPLAIRQRYAELETLRREYRERRATMIARHRALLNPSQADRLQALVEAKRLSRFGSEVGCLYLE